MNAKVRLHSSSPFQCVCVCVLNSLNSYVAHLVFDRRSASIASERQLRGCMWASDTVMACCAGVRVAWGGGQETVESTCRCSEDSDSRRSFMGSGTKRELRNLSQTPSIHLNKDRRFHTNNEICFHIHKPPYLDQKLRAWCMPEPFSENFTFA